MCLFTTIIYFKCNISILQFISTVLYLVHHFRQWAATVLLYTYILYVANLKKKKILDEHILEKHKRHKKKKKVKANKQLYLFTLHCELKPYAALKGVPLPNGPRGDEGVNWCRCWSLLHTMQGASPRWLLLEAVLMKC